MYTGFYETDLDKIALCVESIKTAKMSLIEEDGIGSKHQYIRLEKQRVINRGATKKHLWNPKR